MSSEISESVLDPRLYTDLRHHELFRSLRAEHPVFWQEHPDPTVAGFWNFVRYDDITTISRDTDTFSAEMGSVLIAGPEEGGLVGFPDPRGIQMINTDPPRHGEYRRIFGAQFTPRTLATFEAFIRLHAAAIVDAVVERGECDFARDIATQLPLIVTAELLGVPESDRQALQQWSTAMLDLQEDGTARYLAYIAGLARRYREHPEANLTSKMLNASIGGRQLADIEFETNMILLAIAGNETTRSAMAQGMVALLQHPDQLTALRREPQAIGSAVEEILRWTTPTMQMRRTAATDTVVAGQPVRRGEKVVMWYVSGSRDERHFTAPFTFDITRHPNPHLAFGGGGAHFCLGASLARIELRCVLEEVLRRMQTIELVADPAYRVSPNLILGVDSMPIQFTAAAAVPA